MKLNKMGEYIVQKREEMGLTSFQMAKILNTDERVILKLEKGISTPSEVLVKNLAEMFNTNVECILYGEDLVDES